MKESNSNNAETSGKFQAPSLGVRGNISAYNQQLPIKDKSARQQVHVLIEKKTHLYGGYFFQNNMPVPV
jgi:hypothetical protein